jgi:hypothetical protein
MSYIALANITVSGTPSSVTFSSIPASVNGVSLRDLVVVFNGGATTSSKPLVVNYNGDATPANYSQVRMFGDGSAAYSDLTNTNGGGMDFGFVNTALTTNTIFQIMDYSATNKHKTGLLRWNSLDTGYVIANANRWANTAAITSVRIFPTNGNFQTGSTFALYGIAG